jgi:hypothetical protein
MDAELPGDAREAATASICLGLVVAQYRVLWVEDHGVDPGFLEAVGTVAGDEEVGAAGHATLPESRGRPAPGRGARRAR